MFDFWHSTKTQEHASLLYEDDQRTGFQNQSSTTLYGSVFNNNNNETNVQDEHQDVERSTMESDSSERFDLSISSDLTSPPSRSSASESASSKNQEKTSMIDYHVVLEGSGATDSYNDDAYCSSSLVSPDEEELHKNLDTMNQEQEPEDLKLESYHDTEIKDIEKGVAGIAKFGENDEFTYTTRSTRSTVSSEDWNISTRFENQDEGSNKTCCTFPRCGRGLTFPGWEAYNKNLDENPVITKACTSLFGWFLGDFVTQTVITGGPFDFRRSITLASFGFFFHGPVGHVIYDNLDRIIVGVGPKEVIAKILVDQVLWCPVFMVCYFTYLGLAHGDSPSMIIAKIHEDIFTAILGSWKIWPLAHSFQFRYVQTKHRIVYINCIEVCFIMFLSFLGNS